MLPFFFFFLFLSIFLLFTFLLFIILFCFELFFWVGVAFNLSIIIFLVFLLVSLVFVRSPLDLSPQLCSFLDPVYVVQELFYEQILNFIPDVGIVNAILLFHELLPFKIESNFVVPFSLKEI